MKEKLRCEWVDGKDALMAAYHDEEWGVPLHDDKKIFEFLLLESFQAGLSWRVVLNKRKYLRRAFARFEPAKVARLSESNMQKLLQDPNLIRNRAKIEAAVGNAKRFLEVQKEFGSFSAYMWRVVGGRPVVHAIRKESDRKATSKEAQVWAKDLKKRGFAFLGPVVLYSHMQATGMVNDHTLSCFRRTEV